jgi:hypothetical protein
MPNQAASVFGESDSQDDARFTQNRDAEPIKRSPESQGRLS